MLNQSRVVNTLPFPERDTEVLQNSSCVATLVEHGVFILLYPPPRKKWRACACGWGDWGSRVWSMGDWFYVCVRAHVCVLESWLSARPPTFCSVTPLCSLALCTLEKVFISPAPKHSRVFTVKGEKASVLHTCFSVCSYILQAGPVWEGCELLLKHKAVHSYLLYLVVAYKKKYIRACLNTFCSKQMKSSVPGKRHKWLTENELVYTHFYLTYLYVTKQKQAQQIYITKQMSKCLMRVVIMQGFTLAHFVSRV